MGSGYDGDQVLAADAEIVMLYVEGLRSGETGWADRSLGAADRAIKVFEAAGDERGLARAWRLVTWVHGTRADYGEAVKAAGMSLEHARAMGDQRKEMSGASAYAMGAFLGPTPVTEAVKSCEQLASQAHGDRGTEALVLFVLGQLNAMEGDFEKARRLTQESRSMLDDLGRRVLAASFSADAWRIEVLAGDPAAALPALRRDYEQLDSIGERYFLSTVAGALARVLELTGEFDEASRYCLLAEELTGQDDLVSDVTWRAVRARLLATKGRSDEALAMIGNAVARVRPTDAAVLRADTLIDQSVVLARCGVAGASEVHAEAIRMYEAKGDVAAVKRYASVPS